jgi:NTE family protein
MEIDTLILSGGGVNCLGLFGSLKYLEENKIIKKDFKNIKTIIGVSGGIFNIIPFLLNLSYESIIKIVLNYDCEKIIDLENFTINDILLDYGILTNPGSQIIETILINKGLSKELTLIELYNLTNINLISKVVNLTQSRVIYVNHESHPNLKLTVVCDMTSCIPGIFKPIIYEDEYYVDGAVCGNFPIEKNVSDNYLGINIDHNIPGINDINDISDYFKSLWNMIGRENEMNEENIINIKIKMMGTKFNISEEEKKMIIKEGYLQTEEHFLKISNNS